MRDKIEFLPQPVEFLLLVLVEDQIVERCVVAIVSHHQMKAGTQEPPRVLFLGIEVHAAALGNQESVGEQPAKPLDRPAQLFGVLLAVGLGQLAAASICRDFPVHPENQRLRTGTDAIDLEVTDGHDEFRSLAKHEVAHLLAATASHCESIITPLGQLPPHFTQLGERTSMVLGAGQGGLDHCQILRTDLIPLRKVVQPRIRLSESIPVSVLPRREKEIGVVDVLPLVERHDTAHTELVAIAIGDRGMWSEGETIPQQYQMVGDMSRGREVLLQQSG